MPLRPVKKKRKFIDKKNALSFKLVHRSQRDPELANPEASQFVLKPIEEDKGNVSQAATCHSTLQNEKLYKDAKKEVLQEFGIDFDDEYDYLQHLKLTGQVADSNLEPVEMFVIYRKDLVENINSENKSVGVHLPVSAFPSYAEEAVGLLNKAAPQGLNLSLDPDVIAALADDFDFDDPDNKLEDDFFSKAGSILKPQDKIDDINFEDNDDTDDDDVPSDECEMTSGSDFESDHLQEETQSHFSNFSLTSSVIRRNDKLKLLDDMFDKVYEKYGDEELGALDGEELSGPIDPDSLVMQMLLEEYQKTQTQINSENYHCIQSNSTNDKNEITDNSSDDENVEKLILEEPQKQWDCQSITSTYSNLYNHPKLIKVIPSKIVKVSQRTGIPKNVVGNKGLSIKELAKHNKDNDDVPQHPQRSIIRCHDETPEERKARKAIVKEQRRERRMEKKANKIAFKEEEKEQTKTLYNLQRNLHTIKLV